MKQKLRKKVKELRNNALKSNEPETKKGRKRKRECSKN